MSNEPIVPCHEGECPVLGKVTKMMKGEVPTKDILEFWHLWFHRHPHGV